jgi:hypothetical protein
VRARLLALALASPLISTNELDDASADFFFLRLELK